MRIQTFIDMDRKDVTSIRVTYRNGESRSLIEYGCGCVVEPNIPEDTKVAECPTHYVGLEGE